VPAIHSSLVGGPRADSKLAHRLGAEALGTFWLVFGGCGAAILAAKVTTGDGKFNLGIAFVGVALAFGLTVLTMAYAVGHISGGHFNPAVTVGLAMAKRFPWRDVLAYVVTQVVAATLAATVLFIIARGKSGFSSTGSGFAANGYGDHSPDGYSLLSALLVEVVLTAFFRYVILVATDGRAPVGFAPIAIGLSLTLIHLISIRSTTPASIRLAPPVSRSSPVAGPSDSCGCSGSPRSSAR